MNFLSKLKIKYKQWKYIIEEMEKLPESIEKIQEALGRIENRQLRLINRNDLKSNTFRVFSQWGEDGIIQFLLHHVKVPRNIFVEFGVQNYKESNTRFLLTNCNWSGLVIDCNIDDIFYIKNDPIYWQYNLKAVHAFITRDNINNLLVENGIKGDIGLLSIDIDGNDYWIWEAIDVVKPAVVIIEYNYRFGNDRAVTITYQEDFIRARGHYSMIYYGASLKALCILGDKKGYSFVGCNDGGDNAFFVRKDLKGTELKELSAEEGYVVGQFREALDKKGRPLYLSFEEEKQIVFSLNLTEVE